MFAHREGFATTGRERALALAGDALIALAAALCIELVAVNLWRAGVVVNGAGSLRALRYELVIGGALLLAATDLRFRWLRRLPGPLGWLVRGPLLAFLLAVAMVLAAILSHAWDRPAEPADAAVVLGMALEDGEPNRDLCLRVETAAAWAAENPEAALVVTGGNGEAGAMRAMLVDLGVDPGRIIVEDQAADTLDNFRRASALVDPARPVVVVTSGYHMLRAAALARDAGFGRAQGLSAPTDGLVLPVNLLHEVVGYADCVTQGRAPIPIPFR